MSENKNDISAMFKKDRKRTASIAEDPAGPTAVTSVQESDQDQSAPTQKAGHKVPTEADKAKTSTDKKTPSKPVVPGILTPEMFKKVRKYALKKGLTHSELLVMAFNEVPREDLKARFAVDDSDNEGMMPASKPRRRANGSGSAQIQYWLDERQKKWFLAQPELLGAPSRSAMLMALYELFFERIESSN